MFPFAVFSPHSLRTLGGRTNVCLPVSVIPELPYTHMCSNDSPQTTILIDCTQITRLKAGVGVYSLNLIRELMAIKPLSAIFFLLVQDDDPDFLTLEGPIRIIRVKARFFRTLVFRFLLEQIYIPWLVYKLRIDVVHSLHYSFPILPLKATKLVTVHDMTFFLMPAVHERMKVLYFRAFIWASSHLDVRLIFVSRSTRNDYHEKFGNADSRSRVIPLGVSGAYCPGQVSVKARQVIAKYDLHQPYVLYLGTIEPRKNLARLLEAFALVADSFPEYSLVIAGKKGWMTDDLFKIVTKMDLHSRVIFPGFVGEDDKPDLLRGATAFVYLSLYEGFGIPVLEAMACGLPTITSDISSLPEVAGDGAILVDPEDIASIGKSIRGLLSDSQLRQTMSARAISQAKLFSWKKVAAETLDEYLHLSELKT